MTENEILHEALTEYEENNYMNRDDDWQDKINRLISDSDSLVLFTEDELEVIYNELESRLADYEGYEDGEGVARVKPIVEKLWQRSHRKTLDK